MKLYVTGVAITLLFYTGSWSQVSARIGERGLNEEDRTGGIGTTTTPSGENCVTTTTEEGGMLTTRTDCYESMSTVIDRQGGLPTIPTTGTVQAGKGSGMIMPALDRVDSIIAGKGSGMMVPTGDRTDGTQVVGTVDTGNTQIAGTVNMGNTGTTQSTYDSSHSTTMNTDRTDGTQVVGGVTTGSIPVISGATLATGNTEYVETIHDTVYTVDRTAAGKGGVVVTGDRVDVMSFGSKGSKGGFGADRMDVTTVGSKGSKGGFGADRIDVMTYASKSGDRSGNAYAYGSKGSKGGSVSAVRTGGIATHGTTISTSYTGTGTTLDRTGGVAMQGSLPVVANVQMATNQLPYVAPTYTANGFAP